MKKVMAAVQDHNTILTRPYRQHLMSHQDEPYPPDIAEWIRQELVKPGRDRSGSFSGSSATQCLRRQELQFLGMPQSGVTDPDLQNIFDDGTWRHLRWQARLLWAGLLQGDDVHDSGVEVPMSWRKRRLRGSADGMGFVPDNHPVPHWRGKKFGFELKGVNPFLYAKIVKGDQEIKDEHRAQVHNYFLMYDFDLFIVLYENKGTQQFFEWVIEPDERELEARKSELTVLNKAVDDRVLHPMLPECKARKEKFEQCPFGGESGACLRTREWPNRAAPRKKIRKRVVP